jgi:1,4-dihydroxy-6-naphthoate synthase
MKRPDPRIRKRDERPLSLGFSPCPNDTFIFHALVHHPILAGPYTFEPRLEDVETLNRLALEQALDVTKVSYGVLPFILEHYALLRTGGALGRGCGPLIVAREPLSVDRLRTARIGIPGRYTTAYLLLRLFDSGLPAGIETPYHDIMPAVAGGELDAGLIIHESRFTYPAHGLVQLVDLGQWWEETTGAPIPLGAIVARRSLGRELESVERAIRQSVEAAFQNPDASAGYVRDHAQEMSADVTRQHIELYVNRFSLDLGEDGGLAVEELLKCARGAGLIPESAPEAFRLP